MDQNESQKRSNATKQAENDAVAAEVEQTMKLLTILDQQNIELEMELERFVISDNEIRTKLADRQGSPLRIAEVY